MAMTVSLSLTSCKSADEQLKEAVAECNADCPMEVEDGIYLLSFEIDGRNVKINVALERSTYGEVELKEYTNAIGSELENILTSGSDTDVNALAEACRETNRGVVVNVEWNDYDDDECWQYSIKPSEL